jgi:hypothetical protein
MATWKDFIQLGEKANEHRKRGQFSDAEKCLKTVIEAFQFFAHQAKHQGDKGKIILANWDLAVAEQLLAEVYLETNQPKRALPHFEAAVNGFRLAAKFAGGETRTDLKKRADNTQERINKISNFEKEQLSITMLLAHMNPIARKATMLYGRRLMQLSVQKFASAEDSALEFQRACIDAFFEDRIPTESDQEQFTSFILKNAETMMKTALRIAGNYNFHPFITQD